MKILSLCDSDYEGGGVLSSGGGPTRGQNGLEMMNVDQSETLGFREKKSLALANSSGALPTWLLSFIDESFGEIPELYMEDYISDLENAIGVKRVDIEEEVWASIRLRSKSFVLDLLLNRYTHEEDIQWSLEKIKQSLLDGLSPMDAFSKLNVDIKNCQGIATDGLKSSVGALIIGGDEFLCISTRHAAGISSIYNDDGQEASDWARDIYKAHVWSTVARRLFRTIKRSKRCHSSKLSSTL